MTASTTSRMTVSKITLAFAEASGWYMPNYAMAEPLYWGKNKGCSFLNNACLSGSTSSPTASSDEFCDSTAEKSCDFEATSSGLCYTVTGTLSNSVWNYFGNSTLAADSFSDNCPYIVGYSNRFCGPGGSPAGFSPEYFQSDSACFDSTVMYTQITGYGSQGQCYKYQVRALAYLLKFKSFVFFA